MESGNFELDPGEVTRVEGLLSETGGKIQDEAVKASNSILGLKNVSWAGGASTAAVNKQNEFVEVATKLHTRIDAISEALGMGRVMTTQMDLDNEQSIMQVTPGNSNNNVTRL